MSPRIEEVVVDCQDPRRLAEFWRAVLGWVAVGVEPDGAIEIGDPGSGSMTILFQPVTEPKTVKNRLHLDVRPTDKSHSYELARLLGLGARPVGVGHEVDTWVVLADPEGNEFCLLSDADQE